jgi:hypothetical protein
MPDKVFSAEEVKAKLKEMEDGMDPLWVQLTDKMQVFVRVFIETRNMGKAASVAYKCESIKSARHKAKGILRNWKVRAILSQLCGYEVKGANLSRDEILSLISDRLRTTTEGGSFQRLLTTYLMLTGQLKRDKAGRFEADDSTSTPELDIDDVVKQMEKQNKEQANG